MRKNVASQIIGAQMTTASDGTNFTGSVSVAVTVDGGTQGAGGGTGPTHEGNGFHSYIPTQAETNGNHVAFTFTGSGAITATVQVYPVSYDPTDSVRLGLTALPNAAADAAGGLPISDAGGLDLDTLNTNVSSILTDTAEIGTAGAGLTNINLPNQTMDIVGNITGNLSGSVGSVTGAVGSVTGNVGGTINGLTATALADFFDTDSGTTYASAVAGSVVAEIADNAGGSALTEAGIADAVWDELQSGHVGAGTFGEVATEIASILVDTAEIGAAGAGLTEAGGTGDHLTAINLPNQTMDITGNITGNLSGSVGSVTGAINTAAGTITTLDALDTAQDSQHSTTQGKVDTAQADLDILTGTDGATLATSQANYAPATAAALTTVDTVVDGIKAKTDSLTFTTAGQVDSNVQYVNDVAVGGTGALGDEWGPA